jgi:hypothetical protein
MAETHENCLSSQLVAMLYNLSMDHTENTTSLNLLFAGRYYNKYYVFGHYPSSCPFFKNHSVLETGFCLHPQVKPTQLDPIDRVSPHLRTPMSVSQKVYKTSTTQTTCKR